MTTKTDETARRYVSDFLTPSAVDAAVRWQGTTAYADAFPMLAGFARRYADADDVASVAGILLGDALDSGLVGSLAAGSAVKRAAQNLYAVARDALTHETPAGDTRESEIPSLSRATFRAPDACARCTARDTVTAVLDALDPASAEILARGSRDDVADPRARHGVSAVALASAYGVNVTRGRASAVWGDRYADAREEVARVAVPLLALPDVDVRKGWQGEADRTRWEDDVTPRATPVVTTLADGTRWHVFASGPRPFRALALTGDGAAVMLSPASVLTGDPHAGTVHETRAADLLSATPTDTRAASAIPGATPGARVGHALAGQGTAYRRPTPRKRKRDGGIGGPMTRG